MIKVTGGNWQGMMKWRQLKSLIAHEKLEARLKAI